MSKPSATGAKSRSWLALSNCRGAAIVEFAVVAPVFLLCLFGVLGAGLDALYQEGLDDAVRDAARQIRIAGPAANSSGGFVSAVCAEFAVLAPNCSKSLSYSVQSSTNGFSAFTPSKLSASGSFPNTFVSGAAPGVAVLVQVAYPLPFTIPLLGSALTGTNTNTIVSANAIKIEPYQ